MLIDEARRVADDLVARSADATAQITDRDLLRWARLLRTMADYVHSTNLNLAARRQCHEQALTVADQVFETLSETVRAYNELVKGRP